MSAHDDERGGWYARPEPPAPKRLGDVLPEVTRGLGLPDPSTIRELRAAWPDLVGGQIASHSHPRTLRDRVLTIAVDSAPWATQLRYLEADLLTRLQARVGLGAVERVRLAVDPSRGPRE